MPEKTVEQAPDYPIQPHPTVEVGMPSVMRIELVQGNELRHYEIFFSLASLCASTATGFWTSFFSATENDISLFFSALSFSLLALFSGGLAVHYRRKVFDGKTCKSLPLNKFR